MCLSFKERPINNELKIEHKTVNIEIIKNVSQVLPTKRTLTKNGIIPATKKTRNILAKTSLKKHIIGKFIDNLSIINCNIKDIKENAKTTKNA